MKEVIKDFDVAPEQAPIKKTVGEEFTNWAEKYWGLKISYELFDKNTGEETCTYDYIKSIFIAKIDDLIKERLL